MEADVELQMHWWPELAEHTLFHPFFSRILFPQSIIKPSKYKVMQGKKCGVSRAAKSQPTLPCFQVQVAQALQTTYSSRGACLLVGGWGRTCLACWYGMEDIFSTKMRADHSTTFNIHHLNKPLFHWMILQLWLWRTITHIIHFDIVFIMNHFELVFKIREIAYYVLCVCVTAKGFETNSFFFFFLSMASSYAWKFTIRAVSCFFFFKEQDAVPAITGNKQILRY